MKELSVTIEDALKTLIALRDATDFAPEDRVSYCYINKYSTKDVSWKTLIFRRFYLFYIALANFCSVLLYSV